MRTRSLSLRPPALLLGLALALSAAPVPPGDGGAQGRYAARACTCDACRLRAADPETLLDSFLGGVVPETFCEGTSQAEEALAREVPLVFYARILAARPDALGTCLDLARERFVAPGAGEETRARVLDLASMFPGRIGAERVAALWSAAPAAFGPDHLVALAQVGPAAMRAALRERATREVLPAAYLAFGGDGRGRATLEHAVEGLDLDAGPGSTAALAAAALDRLDGGEALARVRAAYEEAALAALDAGDVARARTLALEDEFLQAKLLPGTRTPELAWFAERASIHVRERAPELADAAAVFDLVERLRS